MNRFETTVLVICILFAISFMIMLLSLPVAKEQTSEEKRIERRQMLYERCVMLRMRSAVSITDCDNIK